MNTSDIEPAGRGPVWPLAVQPHGNAALPAAWGQQTYGESKPLDLNIATIWRIVMEWRWLILGSIAVAVAAAIIITLLTTPLYRAVAVLEMSPPSVEVMENSKAKSGGGGDDRAFLATQYGLLQSRSLAERVAQDLNLASKPEFVSQEPDRATRQKISTAILQGNFDVDPVPNSRLVRIGFSSPSPQLAQQITNSFADNFINSNLERRYQASSYARNFLERQIAKVKGELERAERQLVAYAQQQNIINTGGKEGGGDVSSLQGNTLVALNAALSAATSKRIAAEERYRQARGTTASDVAIGTSGLRTQRAGLEAEYQEKLAQFKPDYPEMVRLRSKIESLDRALTAETGVLSGGRTTSLLADFRAAAAEEQQLQAKVNQFKSSVLDLRGRSIQYNILQREADTSRSLYDALLQKYKEIGVASGIGQTLVSVVDRAETPGGAYTPNLMLNLMIGFGIGLAGGLLAALVLEFINDTIKTPDDVREKLHLASLGVIPKKKGNEPLSDELKDQSSPISEAYFSLRTSLQFTTDTGAPKSLLITSTRAAEGKSSTTLALAQNFARLGNRVLLIDGDLRKPAFVTGLEPSEGLSKLLTNADPLEKHILGTEFENLSLLPCGPLPPNPAELLASPRLRAIIANASEKFDIVIVDGPPVLGLADAPLLSAACRGTLLVIESGKTRTKAALDAVNRLRASGGQILGAVLTKFRHQAHGYGYGYSYEPYRYGGIGSREREIRLIAQREA